MRRSTVEYHPKLGPWQIAELERDLLDTPVSEWSAPSDLVESPPRVPSQGMTVNVPAGRGMVSARIAMNLSGHPRLDAVCEGQGGIVVVMGTPAAAPVLPPIPSGLRMTAQVTVYSGASSITNADVADVRTHSERSLPVGESSR